VTDAKRAQERLLHDAVHDSLTGLPNRELFLDRLAIAAKRATLEPLVRPALLFIDIDKFKSVNTAFGLIVGDSLLLTIARRLGRNLGPQDTLGRVGGDQFALLLLNQSDARELAMLAEQVRRSLRAPINIAGQEIVLTASIGIALYDGPDEDPAELLREAEIAMYRAKRAGPDKIEIFSAGMRTEKDGRLALEGDLRRAIEKKQLRLVYQPIFYLPTESLAGFEALLRWEHPSLGTLNPTDFVPVAEESDLIVKLGSYVLARAVREAARWHKELPRPDTPLFVSVNVSSRQLFRPELIKEVRHILGRAVIPKGSLRLEITESLVMENPEKATAVLRQLADAGAGLSLDDFGTGYSSLSYLNQFTFDTIKIDRSFLHASGENGSGSVILRSVVALSHELGKNVVIEGVETEDDVSLLRSIGCEYGQGFFYGEPMSEREVLALLKVRAGRAAHEQEGRPPAPASEARRGAVMRPRRRLAGPSEPPAAPPRRATARDGRPYPQPPAARREASADSERAGAAAGNGAPAAGPPPLPDARPADTANDGVRLNTLPPTPCVRDRAEPARTRPSATPARPSGPGRRHCRRAAQHGPPRRRSRTGSRAPAAPGAVQRAAADRSRPRCRRPSPNALPSSPEAVAPASDVRRQSGVAGVADEVRGVDSDLRQRPLVFLLEIAIEQQIGVGRAVQPAVGGDFALELAGAPAGIAERQDRPVGPLPPAMALRMSMVAVSETPSSIGSVESAT
jgi:diguanylate cyclase (GGDEF)-like protein